VLALAIAIAGCASMGGALARDTPKRLAIVVDPRDLPGAEVEAAARWRPTRCVPFLSCELHLDFQTGRSNRFQRKGAGKPEALEAEERNGTIAFEPKWSRFGLAGRTLDGVTVRVGPVTYELRADAPPARGRSFDGVLYLDYPSIEERRGLHGSEPVPVHTVSASIADRPAEIRIRPRTASRRASVADPLYRALGAEGAAWNGWALRRERDGAGAFVHAPSGAELAGAVDAPGTLTLSPGRRVPLPVAPVPREGEAVRAIVIPAARWEASHLAEWWTGGSRFSDGPDAAAEAEYGLPREIWEALAREAERDPAVRIRVGAPAERFTVLELEVTPSPVDHILLVGVHGPEVTLVRAGAWRLAARQAPARPPQNEAGR
jgi:hypothetical protein